MLFHGQITVIEIGEVKSAVSWVITREIPPDSAEFSFRLLFGPEDGRQYVPPKRRTFSEVQDVTILKSVSPYSPLWEPETQRGAMNFHILDYRNILII
jgi:hypothetical protein